MIARRPLIIDASCMDAVIAEQEACSSSSREQNIDLITRKLPESGDVLILQDIDIIHPIDPSFKSIIMNLFFAAALALPLPLLASASDEAGHAGRHLRSVGKKASSVPESETRTKPATERALMMDHKMFHPLTCNDGLSVDDCNSSSSNYYGTLAALINSTLEGGQLKIPCGKCAIVDTTDGSTLSLTNGVDVEGMLYFPPTANLTLETEHIFVQGILKMDPPSTALGNTVRVRMVGSETQYLFPHSENAMACNATTGCGVGKKVIAVAGGTLDIQGLEDETCPSWTKLQSIVPPTGIAESTGCALDHDVVVGDGSFSSYDVGTIDPSGFGKHHYNGPNEIREEEDGNKYMFQRASDRPISASGLSVTLQMECADPPSASNNNDKYLFSIKYRTHGGGGEGNGQPWIQPGNIPSGCSNPIDNEWATCTKVITLTDDQASSSSFTLQFAPSVHPDKNIDYDDIEFRALPQSHEITVADSKAAECWGARSNVEVLITYSGHGSQLQRQAVKTIKDVDTGTGTIGFAQTDIVAHSNFGNPASLDGLSEETKAMAAEVAWLSRPIIFEAEKDWPTDKISGGAHGGHLIILHTPNVAQRIEGVAIRHFGQQGILGRYPVHFHMSGSVEGSIVKNNVVRDSLQRCYVIHGSHKVTIESNVAFDTFGHCYILEDGGEQDNTFLNNLGSRTKNSLIGIGSTDDVSSTLWITNPKNHLIGNIAAGAQHNGIWYELRPIRGASKDLPENQDVDPKSLPLYTFRGNTAHTCGFRAITTYDIGYRPHEIAWFEGISSYHNNMGYMFHGNENVGIKDSFFGFNTMGILSFGNFGLNFVENSTFVGTGDQTGIQAVEQGQLQVKLSHFIGYKASDTALRFSAPLPQYYNELPDFSSLTFDSDENDVNHALSFGIHEDMNVFFHDPNGSMNPDGLPGFFVNDVPHMKAFIDEGLCSSSTNSDGLFCKSICLRRVIIDTDHPADYQMVVRSLTSNKSFVFDKSKWDSRKFDVVLPQDEYTAHFLRISNGEIMIPPFDMTFDDENNGNDPSTCDYITQDSISFECPQDYILDDYTCAPTNSSGPVDPGSVWTRKDAGDCIIHSGIQVTQNAPGDTVVESFGENDWFTYTNVNFGSAEVGQIKLRFKKDNWPGSMEVRLGDQNGPVIGSFRPWKTGGSYVDAYFSINAEMIEGVHHVTFKGLESTDVLNLDWWELAPPVDPADHILGDIRDAGNVLASSGVGISGLVAHSFDQDDFVLYDNVWFGEEGDVSMIRVEYSKGCCGGKIEARLDGRDGPVIGTFQPWQTGGWETIVTATFDVDSSSVSGLHRLCFYGLDSGGIWNFHSFELVPPMPTSSPSISLAPTTSSAPTHALSSLQNGARLDYWFGIDGTSVGDLTGIARFPDSPDSSLILEASLEAPSSIGDSYGSRLQAYVIPPFTCDDWNFYIASDDNSELNLSTDTNPANKQTIATVNSWTHWRQWNKDASQTGTVSLVKGNYYYLEALMKEGGGGDNLSIAWECPGKMPLSVIGAQYTKALPSSV